MQTRSTCESGLELRAFSAEPRRVMKNLHGGHRQMLRNGLELTENLKRL
jgi:hypothetical protein